MFLKDFTTSDEKKIAKINKALKEAFGFTLASNIESGKLESLYTKIADDLYNLKLNLGTVRDKEYAKKLLVKEGLGILLSKVKLDESLLAGPGANAYERVIKWLSEFVTNACEVGDEYEEAIYDAMKHYRSSKYRFNDAMVEQDLRNSTAMCSDVPANLDMVHESSDSSKPFLLETVDSEEEARIQKIIKKMEKDNNPRSIKNLLSDVIDLTFSIKDHHENIESAVGSAEYYKKQGEDSKYAEYMERARKHSAMITKIKKQRIEALKSIIGLKNQYTGKTNESAPPGMEDEVLKLKKQYPGEEEKAFATAWSIYNKKKGKSPKKEACREEQLDELSQGTLKSYMDKSSDDISKREDQVAATREFGGNTASKGQFDKINQRARGRDMARGKLAEDPGHSILDIITPEELERLRGYVAGNGELYADELLFDKLYSYYVNSGEMPYGVAKARTGDPDIWILDQVQADYGDEVLGVEEGGRNPDRYADREWAAQLSAEQPERREFAAKLAPKKKIKDPEGEDYFSYMSKKTTREATEMKEGYVKKLRALLEAEVEQAESIIAAKGFSQELQDMVEKLGRLVNEDLPAVTDQMRDAYGADVAAGFENTVGQTLSGVMDSLKGSKQEVDKAVDSIATGGMPSAATDMESPEVNDLDMGGEEGDLDLDLDMGDELDIGDDLGGADAAAGDEEPLGRAKKESVSKAAQLSRKILEAKAKLAKAKKAKAEEEKAKKEKVNDKSKKAKK
jgi:hypothetical protein